MNEMPSTLVQGISQSAGNLKCKACILYLPKGEEKRRHIIIPENTNEFQFFLVHPGGPFWKDKDAGAWSIPKGEFGDDEDPLAAAKREFKEETGSAVEGNFIPLSPVKQKAGKMVYAWAVEGDINPETIASNTFKVQWPPKSGKWQTYPEVDKAGWFNLQQAIGKNKCCASCFPARIKCKVFWLIFSQVV